MCGIMACPHLNAWQHCQQPSNVGLPLKKHIHLTCDSAAVSSQGAFSAAMFCWCGHSAHVLLLLAVCPADWLCGYTHHGSGCTAGSYGLYRKLHPGQDTRRGVLCGQSNIQAVVTFSASGSGPAKLAGRHTPSVGRVRLSQGRCECSCRRWKPSRCCPGQGTSCVDAPVLLVKLLHNGA